MDRTKYEKKSKRHKRKRTERDTKATKSTKKQHKKLHVPTHYASTASTKASSLPVDMQSASLSVNRLQIDNNNGTAKVEVIHRLPPTLPANMKRPEKGFLRNIPPYQKSFECALQTSYEGFVVDMDVVPNERDIQTTLQSAEMEPFFVTDITQPFGLGTACSPTYVTRCLMGDHGTTYKYLGLRMFAHPWNTPIRELKEILSSRVTNQHLPQLYLHRQSTSVTSDNVTASASTPYQPNPTRPCFDICLINRMTMNKKLKTEPLDEDHKTTVSWHADSSLEHYSTIAVYQTIMKPNTAQNHEHDAALSDKGEMKSDRSTSMRRIDQTSDTENEWSIGLRVSPNIEGPKINHSRNDTSNDGDSDAADIAPPIAATLPSNSAYYLLDDFNHHHQHTVLVNKNRSSSSSSTRYSLTFRLLRDSHNVNDMIHRCQRCISQFHKKGTKTYRFEQLTLNELESEWIRQFYIQGQHHHKILWGEWCDDMTKLWDFWNQLETRTLHTIQMLRYAAEGRCFIKDNLQSNTSQAPDNLSDDQGNVGSNSEVKAERKLRAKRKKAVSSMLELLKRESASTETTYSGENTTVIYELFATALDERATMRELWLSREADPTFKKLKQQYRPIPFPAKFRFVEKSNGETDVKSNANNVEKPYKNIDPDQQSLGLSPMPGTSAELRNLATTIRAWGQAFQSCDSNDLPEANTLDELLPKTATTIEKKTSMPESAKGTVLPSGSTCNTNFNFVPVDWDGWKTYAFGLEMQYPWSSALLDGRKSIETRRYELPQSLLGRKVYIIETPVGKDGVSGIIGDNFQNFQNSASVNEFLDDNCYDVGTSYQRPRIVGWGIFSAVKQYKSQQDFCLDEKYHLVPVNSSYGWQNGVTDVLYGWVVSQHGRDCDLFFSSGVRRYRSLFQLALSSENSKFPIVREQQKDMQTPRKKRRY